MHNLRYIPTKSVDDYIQETKKGLHQQNRDFVADHDAEYRSSYADYVSHLLPCKLEQVKPLWNELVEDSEQDRKNKREHRGQAKSIYDSKTRSLHGKYWKEIETINGGTALVCPLCGLTLCDQLDHYIPRDTMPEFSVFTPNLIPLCHDCNEEKHEVWLNDEGERIIFNAYYDLLPDVSVCKCDIIITQDMPYAKIDINPDLPSDDSKVKLVVRTIDKLKLLKKWQSHGNIIMEKEVVKIENDYNNTIWPIVGDYWEYKKACYTSYLQGTTKWDLIERAIYRSIIDSEEMKNWCVMKCGQL